MFLILLLVCVFPSILTAQNVYHVKLTPSAPCPNTTCHTLSEYVYGASHFFTANTTLVFLPGEHIVEGGVLAVANIGSFVMLAKDTSSPEITTTITCSSPSSFVFTNISEVKIADLNFISCGIHPPLLTPVESHVDFILLMYEHIANLVHHNTPLAFYTSMDKWPNTPGRVPTVMVSSVPNTSVKNCSVESSYLPFFVDHSQALLHDIRLENNTGDYGGGLCTVDSTVNISSTFINYNTAGIDGGGIYVRESHINFQNYIILQNNTAEYGGGLMVFNSTINFDGDSTFMNNSAEISGGGVYADDNSHLVFQNFVRFKNNTARYGGGLMVFNTTITFEGDSTFKNNSAEIRGGGVHADDNSHLVFQNFVRFENNTARYGGGLMVFNTTITFESDSTFKNNSAEIRGGGVYADDNSHLVFQNVRFENNTAKCGGGFRILDSTINFEGDSIFIRNSGEIRGGGIYATDNSHLVFQKVRVENNMANFGGGFRVSDSTINFEGDSTFIDNSGKIAGGGVYTTDNSHLVFQKVRVETNMASYGGGLIVFRSTINFEGDSIFIGNSGKTSGGGVYATDNTHLVFQHVRVENNTANHGGGFRVSGSTIAFVGDTTFIGNVAEVHGGGVFEIDRSHLVFQNVLVENNTAEYGGGFRVSNSTMNIKGVSTFISNSGEMGGGGVHADDNSIINYEGDSTFIGNAAEERGGGIYATDKSRFVFQNLKVENNTANSGGGFRVSNSTIIFEGNTIFISNSGKTSGGGVYVGDNTFINYEGESTFIGNVAKVHGGGIYVTDNSRSVFQNVLVENNTAEYGGGFRVSNSTMNIKGVSTFIGNSGEISGGGVHADDNSIINYEGDSTFIGNAAEERGGGIYATDKSRLFFQNLKVENNTANFGGGFRVSNCTMNIKRVSTFKRNFGKIGGGGVYTDDNSIINYEGDSTFIGNFGEVHGGGVFVANNSHLVFQNVSFETNTASNGGGLIAFSSTIMFEGGSIFRGNVAEVRGGGFYATDKSLLVFQNVGAANNTAEFGGGFRVSNSTINFVGGSTFISNSAKTSGGGVYTDDKSTISFESDSAFIDNFAEGSGGGLYAVVNNNLIFQNVRVENNTATYGGWSFVFKSTIKFKGDSTFIGNSAESNGGALFTTSSSHLAFQNVTFESNTASYGGGLFVYNTSVNFEGVNFRFVNNAADYGGGLLAQNSTVNFKRKTVFLNNSAKEFGGGVTAITSSLTFNTDVSFDSNLATIGGALYGDDSSIEFSGNTYLLSNSAWHGGAINLVDGCQLNVSGNGSFESNSASNGYGGAINSIRSYMTFNGSIAFISNTATYGGGLALSADSTMYLLPNTTHMYFERNVANKYGGAVLIQHDPFSYCITDPMANYFRDNCFLQVAHGQYCNFPTSYSVLQATPDQDWGIHLVFESNSAKEAGSVLYGGNLDRCGFCAGDLNFTIGAPFDTIAHVSIPDSPTNVSIVSSDPFRVSFCNGSYVDCSQRHTTYSKYPGETFSVPIVAVGQRSGTVPALISAVGVTIENSQHIQEANNTCTLLNYTILSSTHDSVAFMTLIAEGPCSDQGDPVQIEVSLRSCPEGFTLSKEGACTCEERLQQYTTQCDINDRSIEHVGEFWVGYDNRSNGLILHPHCPFDYCKPGTFSFTLANPDKQCNNNRSGALCGACQPGFSIILGSSQCSRCSNKFLTLLIAFGIGGLALVILLFIFKLTVAEGTFSGLLFYANIIAANQSAFFPPGETNILTVFIAWLNLDSGIKTCFFDGMDTYAKTWLQFAGPLYIWLLVGMVVMITRYSRMAARIIGNTNPISVLATLFLLSYTKLLQTVIAAFSLTTLEYPDKTVPVWVHDGNIGYLDTADARHISLFLASLLVLIFFFLPYTLVLIFGQCIKAKSQYKMFWWVNNTRLQSFLDAYHAPYKNSHQYWIGLLLMVRFILFITAAISDISSPQDPSLNFLVIIIVTFTLSVWAWNTSGIYKKWYLNALESSFIFNLAILSATTLYVKLAGGNQAAAVYTSVGIAFTTFIGIVSYHMQQRLLETRLWRLMLAPKLKNLRTAAKPKAVPVAENQHNITPLTAPTCTVVELREPLDLITDN